MERLNKEIPQSDITGTQINYYFVCKRKLWFHTHGMDQESESDLVRNGRFLHENSYKRYGLKNVELDKIKKIWGIDKSAGNVL